MKSLSLVILVAMVSLVGCGNNSTGNCSSSSLLGVYNGYFNGDTSDTLTLNANCTGSTTACGLQFTFQPTTGNQGTFAFTITSASNSSITGCPQTTGSTSWPFTLDSTNAQGANVNFTLANNQGSASYFKQQ